MCSSSRRPGPRAFMRNWRASDLPFWPRLRLALHNEWIKISTGQPCCGHYGQPGC